MLRRVVVWNFVAVIIPTLLGLGLVPFYLQRLGPEGFGIAGVFASLQAIFAVVDNAFAASGTRTVAGATAGGQPWSSARSLVRTFEWVYVALGAVAAAGGGIGARLLAERWFRLEVTPTEDAVFAIAVMAFVVACRLPAGLYSGILRGLGRYTVQSGLATAAALVRHGGSALAVLIFEDRLRAFVLWQLVSATAEVVAQHIAVWRLLPEPTTQLRPSLSLLRPVWRFSLGVGFSAACAVVLKQADRLIVSGWLPASNLGYYLAATTAASSIAVLSTPLTTLALPHLARVAAKGDAARLGRAYHGLTEVLAFAISPVAMALAAFAPELLLAWTRSELVASAAAGPLAVLAVAAAINTVMQASYALQLSVGITRISNWVNLVGTCAVIPALMLLVPRLGLVGAALPWMGFNVAYFVAAPLMLHRRALPGQAGAWFLRETLPYLAASAAWAFGSAGLWREAPGTYLPRGVFALGLVLYAAAGLWWSARLRELVAGAIRDVRDRLHLPSPG